MIRELTASTLILRQDGAGTWLTAPVPALKGPGPRAQPVPLETRHTRERVKPALTGTAGPFDPPPRQGAARLRPSRGGIHGEMSIPLRHRLSQFHHEREIK